MHTVAEKWWEWSINAHITGHSSLSAGWWCTATPPVSYEAACNIHKSVTHNIKCTHRNDSEDKQTEFSVHKHCTAGNEVNSVSAARDLHLSPRRLISVLSAVWALLHTHRDTHSLSGRFPGHGQNSSNHLRSAIHTLKLGYTDKLLLSFILLN